MKINLNGKIVEVKSMTLMDLVREQGLDPGTLIIEHNLKVVKQHAWQNTSIQNQDTIELLTFVGGG